jgi:hypothetical protein
VTAVALRRGFGDHAAMMGRFFGWIFLFAAAVVLVRDGLAWQATHKLAFETFGTLWFDISSDSLGVFRGAALGTMPLLWPYVIAPILSLWAGPVLLVLGLFLLASGGRSVRRRRR